MEHDDVLSRFCASTAGKVTWDSTFVLQLVLFAGLPLLAAIAVHFPEVGGPLFDWMQPLLRAGR